jgi:hypothetical protein
MQCNHCGSSVVASDQFCMECGQPIQMAPDMAPGKGTQPTWLPAESLAPAGPGPAAARPAPAAPAGDIIPCPNCGAKLPAGARFCGDCGTRLGEGAAVPAAVPAQPHRVATAALPDPIPPLVIPAPRPPSGPMPAVLPPFQPGNWAAQATPDVSIPDGTLTPLTAAPAAPPHEQPAAAWANQPAPAPWSVQPAAPWPAAPLQSTSNAAEFTPPKVFPQVQAAPAPAPLPAPGPFPPQPAARGASPSQAFYQAMNALPMAPALAPAVPVRRQSLPRGQVITMIITAIITVLAALGGTLLLLLPTK